MADVVILGTVALDNIETPFGKVKNALGGSATYAAYSASFFAKPGIISIVGKDFPKKHWNFLKKHANLEGIERRGKTFRWQGYYEFDMNEAETIKTELNSLKDYKPKVPQNYKNAKYLFLANVHPSMQLEVLENMKNPKLTILDTMNLWINNSKKQLLNVIKKIDILLLNDAEARQLFNTVNLVKAANKALKLGPKHVIIKKGEHGALLFTDSTHFSSPGYPLENIKDPTGSGDSFGGAFIGYLAKTNNLSEPSIRKAMIYASAVASHNAEGFSLNRLRKISMKDIEKRYKEFQEIRKF